TDLGDLSGCENLHRRLSLVLSLWCLNCVGCKRWTPLTTDVLPCVCVVRTRWTCWLRGRPTQRKLWVRAFGVVASVSRLGSGPSDPCLIGTSAIRAFGNGRKTVRW